MYNTMCKIDSWWEPAVGHRELSLVLRGDLEGCEGGVAGGSRQRGCMHRADSLCCSAKTNTTL